MHFILTDYGAKEGINQALKKFDHTPAILSLLFKTKRNCITNEKYQEMYKTNEENDERMDLSVGEDLETFFENIKNGEINKHTIPEDGDKKSTFLLCLLDKEERKKNLNKKMNNSWNNSSITSLEKQMFQKQNGYHPSRI